jgi:hypothetical protein
MQAPKLRAGGYAAWRPDMDVYLARIGADGAHKRAMETQHWLRLVQQVQTWHEETMAEALADIGIGAGSQSASSSDTKEAVKLTDREVTTRKTIRLLVEQSTKAYGAIWSTLPDELRSQASKGGEVPQNFAYGLWNWLEQKFQSTEMDSIGDLLAQWIALQQGEDESFDAYRARVNHLRALLVHAKEPPSDNMYAFMLVDRLQPLLGLSAHTPPCCSVVCCSSQHSSVGGVWSPCSAHVQLPRRACRLQPGSDMGVRAGHHSTSSLTQKADQARLPRGSDTRSRMLCDAPSPPTQL